MSFQTALFDELQKIAEYGLGFDLNQGRRSAAHLAERRKLLHEMRAHPAMLANIASLGLGGHSLYQMIRHDKTPGWGKVGLQLGLLLPALMRMSRFSKDMKNLDVKYRYKE